MNIPRIGFATKVVSRVLGKDVKAGNAAAEKVANKLPESYNTVPRKRIMMCGDCGYAGGCGGAA
jgi:hypothetical protein